LTVKLLVYVGADLEIGTVGVSGIVGNLGLLSFIGHREF